MKIFECDTGFVMAGKDWILNLNHDTFFLKYVT